MSYEMCNRISLKNKTNQIFVNITSNNVWPHTYSRCEYAGNSQYTLEEKILFLMISMLEGNIQISQTNKNTIPYEYALIKIREYYKENNISHYEDRYEKQSILFNEELKKYTNPDDIETYKEFSKNNKELIEKIEVDVAKKLYGKEFEIFKNSINEKIEGKYYLTNKFGDKIEFCGKTKFGFKYRQYAFLNEDCLLDYKLAYIRKDYMGEKFMIEKAEVKQKENIYENDMEEQYAQ